MSDNKTVYETERISKDYFGKAWLFPSEKKILQLLDKDLPGFRMLDVGIGGGRTTSFFAPKVLHYTGIDYSAMMVQYSKETFLKFSNADFKELDARNLSVFADKTFDLVLFSFNGIDCVDYEGRKKILTEFHRVLKPKGQLLFSFHNARHLQRLYSFQWPRNPFKIPGELRRTKLLRKINGDPAQYEGKKYFSLYDGADHFQTCILYLLPEKQERDLEQLGFNIIARNDLQSGASLDNESWEKLTIPWIFIQARKVG